MLFKPTLEAQEYIDNNADKINLLAEKLWDCVNEVEPDPMHPQWSSFEDPIKDKFISAASYLIVACETQILDGPVKCNHVWKEPDFSTCEKCGDKDWM